MSTIVCPYCFGRFKDTEAVFRATRGWTSDELDSMTTNKRDENGTPLSDEEISIRHLFRCYDSLGSYGSNPKYDQELLNFWSGRGGEGAFAAADPSWNLPHIVPGSMAFKRMTVRTPLTDENGFVRDRDGFVMRVFDRYSTKMDQPMERLCPHCHNPLPLPDYGKYPTLFISVVGVTSAGKTVYLKQMLGNLASAIQSTGYHIGTVNLDKDGGVVAAGQPLPGSTDTQTMRRPMAVSLLDNENSAKGVTLVFYDIAGENCVAAMHDEHTLIGHFIARSDALLFLIDPQQVPVFATVQQQTVAAVQEVIQVVNGIRASLNPDHPSWEGIPVAVVLTKSDSLRGKLPPDSPAFQDICCDVPGQPGRKTKGFVRNEFIQINKELSKRFAENAAGLLASVAAFNLHGFFAVSALVDGVEVSVEKYRNRYQLDTVNEGKFYRLRDWAREWNQRTPQEREHFPNCPVCDREGRPIYFDVKQNITEELGDQIVTEIFGVANAMGTLSQEYLTLTDVVQRLNPLSYPIGTPRARRVEEPILWILWEKRYIEPYFTGQEAMPRKGFFWSTEYYNAKCEEVRQKNRQQEQRFYYCQ